MSDIKKGEVVGAITYIFSLAFFLYLAFGLAGCGGVDVLPPLCETPEVGSTEQYIVNGEPSTDRRATVAVVADRGYCSAIRIGVNTFLTAAHCEGLTDVCLAGIRKVCTPIVEDIEHPTAHKPGPRDLRIVHTDMPDYLLDADVDIATLDDGSVNQTCSLLAQGYGYGSDGALHERTFKEGPRFDGILYGSESVCNGDSGGPAYRVNPDGSYTLVAVTSFGLNEPYDCTGGAVGFVDITQGDTLAWIQENIR